MVRFLCFSMEWFWNAWVCVAGLDTGQIFKSHSWDRDATNPFATNLPLIFEDASIRWYIDFAKNIEMSKLSRIFWNMFSALLCWHWSPTIRKSHGISMASLWKSLCLQLALNGRERGSSLNHSSWTGRISLQLETLNEGSITTWSCTCTWHQC